MATRLHPSAADSLPVDMSAEAIDERLRNLSDLWDFWARLELDRKEGRLIMPGAPSRPESASAALTIVRLDHPRHPAGG